MSDPVENIILKGLRKIGKIPEEQEVPGYMVSRGLELLNDILDEWGASRIFIPYQSELTLPLINNQQIYLIGNSSLYSLNTNQVIEILELVIQVTSASGQPVTYDTIQMTEQQYATIAFRTAQGTPAQWLLRNHVDYSEIRFQPVPSFFNGTMNALILCKQRLSRVTEGQNLAEIPNHFLLALKLQLSLYAQDIFGVTLPPEQVSRTQKTLDNLLASNFNVDFVAQIDEQINSGWWAAGYYGYRYY